MLKEVFSPPGTCDKQIGVINQKPDLSLSGKMIGNASIDSRYEDACRQINVGYPAIKACPSWIREQFIYPMLLQFSNACGLLCTAWEDYYHTAHMSAVMVLLAPNIVATNVMFPAPQRQCLGPLWCSLGRKA